MGNTRPMEAERYLCPGSDKGFITDKAAIGCLRAENRLDEINNFLMGSFTDRGEYHIDKQIVQELLGMRKIEFVNEKTVNTPGAVVSKTKELIFADSKAAFVPMGNVHFAVEFSVADGKGVAFLNLMENVERANGYVINTNTYRLAKYVSEPDKAFKLKARKAFNIVTQIEDDEDGGQKMAPEVFPHLLVHIGFITVAQKIIEKRLENMQEQHLRERLEALLLGVNGKRVLDAYNLEREKIEQFFLQNKKNKYRSLNEVLSRVIDVAEANGTQLEPEVKNGLAKANELLRRNTEEMLKETDKHRPEKPQEKVDAKRLPPKVMEQTGKVGGGKVETAEIVTKFESGAGTPKTPASEQLLYPHHLQPEQVVENVEAIQPENVVKTPENSGKKPANTDDGKMDMFREIKEANTGVGQEVVGSNSRRVGGSNSRRVTNTNEGGGMTHT
ncbi:MAG: hypothetical protein FWE53_00725 [Firmicutes bacterium]|nr:hypothetical protein [Bacillota bacterium]